MIDQSTLIIYIAVLFGFVFIPGPAVVLTVARATRSGPRAGLATGLGIAVGDLIHTLLAVLGLSAIILTSAVLFSLIKYLGAAYLVYLGIRSIMEKTGDAVLAENEKKITPYQAFHQAILVEVLNPKSAIFFLAFLPQFVKPENGAVPVQLMLLGVLFVVTGLLSTIFFAVCAGGIGKFLRRNPVVLRWQNKVIGGIYCVLGLRLAFQEK